MMIKMLVNGLIVIFVLMVVIVGFFSLYPEARDNISKLTDNILGLGFAKSDEDIRATVKLAKDSLDICSDYVSKGCTCDIELDIIPGDNLVLVDNGGSESKFILVNENGQVDVEPWNLEGRKIGVPFAGFDGSNWDVYCNFDDIVLSYDAGWRYPSVKGGTEFYNALFSTDEVSEYSVIKLEDGNFCFVDMKLLEFEWDVGDGANTVEDIIGLGLLPPMSKITKIGPLPKLDGTFIDYYSGQEFYNLLPDCR